MAKEAIIMILMKSRLVIRIIQVSLMEAIVVTVHVLSCMIILPMVKIAPIQMPSTNRYVKLIY